MGGTGEFGPLKSSSVCPETLARDVRARDGAEVLGLDGARQGRRGRDADVHQRADPGVEQRREGRPERAGRLEAKLVGLFVRTSGGSVIVWSMDAASMSAIPSRGSSRGTAFFASARRGLSRARTLRLTSTEGKPAQDTHGLVLSNGSPMLWEFPHRAKRRTRVEFLVILPTAERP